MTEEPKSFVMIGPYLELPTIDFPATKISGLDAYWDYDGNIREQSARFESAKEAVDWALARSKRAYLRMNDGITYWVGTDPCPEDFEQLSAPEAEAIFASIIGTSLPLTDSSEAKRSREAAHFKALRQARDLSVLDVTERSGISQERIEAIEDCSGPYESSPTDWIGLVSAICGVDEGHRLHGGWVIEEGGMLSVALKTCGLDESGNPLGKS
jgi:hypothetical protein